MAYLCESAFLPATIATVAAAARPITANSMISVVVSPVFGTSSRPPAFAEALALADGFEPGFEVGWLVGSFDGWLVGWEVGSLVGCAGVATVADAAYVPVSFVSLPEASDVTTPDREKLTVSPAAAVTL